MCMLFILQHAHAGCERRWFGDRECRCWYSGGQTLIALRIAQKFRTRRLALQAFRGGAQPPSAIALTRRDADCSVWVGIAWSSRDAA